MNALVLWLACASLSPTSQSPAPAPVPAQEAAGPVDERTKELNRILHLAGGGALRAKARWSTDHWEYRAAGAWASLPEAAVVLVRLEREVLAEAKELSKKLDRSSPSGRVQLAEWMLRNGLLDEGVAELERVLEANSDQPDALALLATPPVPIRVPGAEAETLEESLRLAASAPRSLQECAVAALGRRGDREAVILAIQQGLTSFSQRIRCFSALALRRLDPSADVRALLTRAVLDGSEAVRREASFGLRDTREPAVLLPVLRAMGSRSAAVRENAIEALGNIGFEAALEPLVGRLAALASPQSSGSGWRAPASNIFIGRQMAYIQDFDVEVAQFAAVADPQINTLIEGSVLDVRVVGVWETSAAVESRKVRTALRKITGEQPGDSNRAWLAWWEQNRSRYDASKKAPATGVASSD